MGENKSEEWIVEIQCTFCGAVVLEAADLSMLPEEMSDDEKDSMQYREEFIQDCGHIAFHSDWAYVGNIVLDTWKKEMDILAKAIDEEFDPNVKSRETAGRIIDCWRSELDDEDEVEEFLKKVLPQYDSAYVQEFVCKNDGVHGQGGADYGIIFLRRKQ